MGLYFQINILLYFAKKYPWSNFIQFILISNIELSISN